MEFGLGLLIKVNVNCFKQPETKKLKKNIENIELVIQLENAF